jgi:hypothetical protein
MRQRRLMFLKPHPIAHVDVTAAEWTPEIVLGVAQGKAGDLFAHDGAARKWIFQACDFHLITSKKIRPRISPRPDPIRRGVHTPVLPSWFYIVRKIDPVKLRAMAPPPV